MTLLLLASLAMAQEVGAILRPELEIDLASDRSGEDAAANRTRVRAWARGDAGDDGSWFIEVRGVHELLAGEDVEGRFDGEVGESGWEGALAGPVRLRVGNLRHRWGKLDYLPVMDVLNPRDLRYGPLQPQVWQRSPVPMAVVTVAGGPIRWETVVLPFAVNDRFAMRGTDWSFVRQGMLEQQVAAMATWEGDTADMLGDNVSTMVGSMSAVDPQHRRALDAATLQKGRPADTLVNGEAAQRLIFEGKGFDVSVMGARIHTRQPMAQVAPFLATLLEEQRLADLQEVPLMLDAVAEPIAMRWPYTWVAGADASTVIGPVGVRAEGGWQSRRVVRQPWGGAAVTPSATAGLGVDYVHGSTLQIGLEARYERLLQPPDALLFARPELLQLAGGVRISALADRLTVQLGGTYDATFQEWMALPTVTWRASDAVELSVGALLLGGATPPPDTLRDAMTYQGGMLSYFQQNDALTVAVAWIL